MIGNHAKVTRIGFQPSWWRFLAGQFTTGKKPRISQVLMIFDGFRWVLVVEQRPLWPTTLPGNLRPSRRSQGVTTINTNGSVSKEKPWISIPRSQFPIGKAEMCCLNQKISWLNHGSTTIFGAFIPYFPWFFVPKRLCVSGIGEEADHPCLSSLEAGVAMEHVRRILGKWWENGEAMVV